MKKSEAIELFGGAGALAKSLGITSQGLHKWPETLTDTQADRVMGLAIREKGLEKARAWWPDRFDAA